MGLRPSAGMGGSLARSPTRVQRLLTRLDARRDQASFTVATNPHVDLLTWFLEDHHPHQLPRIQDARIINADDHVAGRNPSLRSRTAAHHPNHAHPAPAAISCQGHSQPATACSPRASERGASHRRPLDVPLARAIASLATNAVALVIYAWALRLNPDQPPIASLHVFADHHMPITNLHQPPPDLDRVPDLRWLGPQSPKLSKIHWNASPSLRLEQDDQVLSISAAHVNPLRLHHLTGNPATTGTLLPLPLPIPSFPIHPLHAIAPIPLASRLLVSPLLSRPLLSPHLLTQLILGIVLSHNERTAEHSQRKEEQT
nr:hypothetical protein [Candidatus Laterigemmans baculatus]